MCFGLIHLCCYVFFPKTFYSIDISDGIITRLNDDFLIQLKSNGPGFFNQWRPRILENKKIKNMILNTIRKTLHEFKIPVFKVNGIFNFYLETQLAYFIFESLLHDPLDNTNINNLPLLDIAITDSIFYKPPKKTVEQINIFINRFSRMKEKQIDFSIDINAIDKTLLNMKLELELELAVQRIEFTPLIRRIYNEYNTKSNIESTNLQNEIQANI